MSRRTMLLAALGPKLALVCGACASILFGSACDPATGGAVELSWNLQSQTGSLTSCGDARIDRMRLWWTENDTPVFRSWDCSEEYGSTQFDVPEGTRLLYVTPECESGELARETTYEAPPPIAREVVQGEVVRLPALLIQVQIDDEINCSPDTCICR